MKTKILAAVFLAAGVTVGSPSCGADSLRIGYVDMRQVIVESVAGKAHQAEMEKIIKKRQSALDKETQKLQTLKENFEKNKLTLSDAQMKAEQKEFQDEMQNYQHMASDDQQAVREQDSKYTQKAVAKIRGIIAKIARKDKLNLVFEKTELMVLYSDPDLDITPQVMQQYDASSAGAAK
ncbi:MAG: OmpH/Skp family outer membrane protein [Acidiferrobacterales bacterium]